MNIRSVLDLLCVGQTFHDLIAFLPTLAAFLTPSPPFLTIIIILQFGIDLRSLFDNRSHCRSPEHAAVSSSGLFPNPLIPPPPPPQRVLFCGVSFVLYLTRYQSQEDNPSSFSRPESSYLTASVWLFVPAVATRCVLLCLSALSNT
jgi:hypothetical protein